MIHCLKDNPILGVCPRNFLGWITILYWHAPNKEALPNPLLPYDPSWVKSVLRQKSQTDRTALQFIYGCSCRPDTQLKCAPSWHIQVVEQKSYDVKPYQRLAAEAQLHGSNGARESYRSHTTQLSCQMLPRADAIPQFIQRWRCRLFLRRGPAQTECAI